MLCHDLHILTLRILLAAGNIMLEASNQCINIKIIDCGYAVNDLTDDNNNISTDFIQIYNLLSMVSLCIIETKVRPMTKQMYWDM